MKSPGAVAFDAGGSTTVDGTALRTVVVITGHHVLRAFGPARPEDRETPWDFRYGPVGRGPRTRRRAE
ncbi:hypothetical protein [Streptomyces sp. NPDC058872]|uniref:hypothetical protein n=1 Tax=Streptomyces sp. NPDC058872 TaxID=3346661 RepID=UPI0036D1743F